MTKWELTEKRAQRFLLKIMFNKALRKAVINDVDKALSDRNFKCTKNPALKQLLVKFAKLNFRAVDQVSVVVGGGPGDPLTIPPLRPPF